MQRGERDFTRPIPTISPSKQSPRAREYDITFILGSIGQVRNSEILYVGIGKTCF